MIARSNPRNFPPRIPGLGPWPAGPRWTAVETMLAAVLDGPESCAATVQLEKARRIQQKAAHESPI